MYAVLKNKDTLLDVISEIQYVKYSPLMNGQSILPTDISKTILSSSKQSVWNLSKEITIHEVKSKPSFYKNKEVDAYSFNLETSEITLKASISSYKEYRLSKSRKNLMSALSNSYITYQEGTFYTTQSMLTRLSHTIQRYTASPPELINIYDSNGDTIPLSLGGVKEVFNLVYDLYDYYDVQYQNIKQKIYAQEDERGVARVSIIISQKPAEEEVLEEEIEQ